MQGHAINYNGGFTQMNIDGMLLLIMFRHK